VVKEIRGDFTPQGWHSKAFCTHLHEALSCGISGPDYCAAKGQILSVVRDAQSPPEYCAEGIPAKDVVSTLPVQKRVFALLCTAVPDPWPAFFIRKATVLGIDPPVSNSAFAAEFLTFSKRLPMQARMAALKTWGNSWCTSERYHEEVILPCVLGCSGKDELAHYLECEFFWTLLEAGTTSRTSELHLCKDSRACLIKPSRSSILKLLVAFLAYHALRMRYRDELHRGVEQEDFGKVREIFVTLSRHFWSKHGD